LERTITGQNERRMNGFSGGDPNRWEYIVIWSQFELETVRMRMDGRSLEKCREKREWVEPLEFCSLLLSVTLDILPFPLGIDSNPNDPKHQ
jgi:hypothetical protein